MAWRYETKVANLKDSRVWHGVMMTRQGWYEQRAKHIDDLRRRGMSRSAPRYIRSTNNERQGRPGRRNMRNDERSRRPVESLSLKKGEAPSRSDCSDDELRRGRMEGCHCL